MPDRESKIGFHLNNTLENADRVNLLADTTIFSNTYYIPEGPDGIKDLTGAEDNYGKKYVKIMFSPKKQRFISLLMTPVCGLADVIPDKASTQPQLFEGNTSIYYSHMIDLNTIEQKTEIELRSEIFLLDVITYDGDHYTLKDDHFYLFQNLLFQDNRYYIFDFDRAFYPPGEIFRKKGSKRNSQNQISKKFKNLFRDDTNIAIPILNEKIKILQELYDNEEGYSLFVEQLKQAGISDDLNEIFEEFAILNWKEPTKEFYRFFILRINTLKKFLENYGD